MCGFHIGGDADEIILEATIGLGCGIDHFYHDQRLVIDNFFSVEYTKFITTYFLGTRIHEISGLAV